jgi:pyruvate,water dikinase
MLTGTILPLTSKEANLENAGGKGANLVRLARAGFAVPPGFIITTSAYLAFVDANDLQRSILAVLQGVSPDDPASLQAASDAIRERFSRSKLPPEMAADIKDAYTELDSPPVAVRSSATAEDLPGMSFAGQQDTFLNIIGERALLQAVISCFSSLWTARAIGYRARNSIPHAGVSLAVVVQRMVPAEVSGVMFTANPLTGARQEIVIDATLGLGEALVSGLVEPDHYVVDISQGKIISRTLGAKALVIRGKNEGGVEKITGPSDGRRALSDDQILALSELGQRVAAEYSFPQDIEWARSDGDYAVLQSRPITSLFPLPAETGPSSLRVFFSFGAVQGMLDPMTPLGRDAIRLIFAGGASLLGYARTHNTQGVIHSAGERLWGDATGLLRNRLGRRLALGAMNFIEPGARQAMQRIKDDPRLQPESRGPSLTTLRRLFPLASAILRSVLKFWRNPARQRARAQAECERAIAALQEDLLALQAARAAGLGPESSLAQAVALYRRLFFAFPTVVPTLVPGIVAGMSLFSALHRLVSRLSIRDAEMSTLVLEITRGVPDNVTTEMDLALWQAARAIRQDPVSFEHLQGTGANTLAQQYLAARLPAEGQAAIGKFLEKYGVRGVGEIDIGRPRWREDPTHIMQVLSSYLRIEDPDQAPDAVFRRGAAAAELAIDKLAAAVRLTTAGSLKARFVRWATGRLRALIGLRESPKFYIVRMMAIVRQGLLEIGADLAAAGYLDRQDDLFFLSLDELDALAADGSTDWSGKWKPLISKRRQDYQREYLRQQVPRLLLSDGRAFYEGLDAGIDQEEGENLIVGSPVSPGVVEGLVRVIFDPQKERLEPGEILVCPGTDPAWTPLFLAAAGLVMEVGGMMTHGSVVAREYGIPAVVGVHQATTRLKTGQRVRVDGTTGRISLLDEIPSEESQEARIDARAEQRQNNIEEHTI